MFIYYESNNILTLKRCDLVELGGRGAHLSKILFSPILMIHGDPAEIDVMSGYTKFKQKKSAGICLIYSENSGSKIMHTLWVQ